MLQGPQEGHEHTARLSTQQELPLAALVLQIVLPSCQHISQHLSMPVGLWTHHINTGKASAQA